MKLRHLVSVAAFAAAAALLPSRASALEFAFGGLEGTQARDGFIAAGNRWSANFSDNFKVTITIGFEALPANVLAQASSTFNAVTFNSGANNINKFRLRLQQDATSADDQAALQGITAATTLPMWINRTTQASPVEQPYYDNNGNANNTTLSLTDANQRAVGLSPNNIRSGTITFSSAFNWDFDPTDGITPGAFDFVGLATHEIGHTLGFSSGVDTLDAQASAVSETSFRATALDLFRYSVDSRAQGPGTIDVTADARDKFFSLDGGTTKIASFATGVTYGDGTQASHWKDGMGLGIEDPTASPGELLSISELDRRAFDVIGYDRVYRWGWLKPVNGSWQSVALWATAGVPTNEVTAVFDHGGTGGGASYAVTLAANTQAKGIEVGRDALSLELSNRTMTVTTVDVAPLAGQAGSLTLVGGGTLAATNVTVGRAAGGAAGMLHLVPGAKLTVADTLRIHAAATATLEFDVTAQHVVNAGTFNHTGGRLTVNGTFTNIAGDARLAANQTWAPGAQLAVTGGSVRLERNAGSAGVFGPAVVVDGAGAVVTFAASQHLASLSVLEGAARVSSPETTILLRGLSIGTGGTFDLNGSDLILFYDGAPPLAALRDWIATGAITAPVGDGDHPTTYALLDNMRLRQSSWEGHLLNDGFGDFEQLLLRHAYVGDVNVDGRVDDLDYANLVANLGSSGTWFEGDVDLDGLVTRADFDLVTAHLGAGDGGAGGPQFAAAAFMPPALFASVPEPGSITLLLGAVSLLVRRRRRATRSTPSR